jgi:hypothetical protein
MRKLPIAALALLFGTSAYAMIPSNEPGGVMVQPEPAAGPADGTLAPVADEGTAVQPAAVDWWAAGEPAGYKADPTLKPEVAMADDKKADATDPAFDADGWAAAAADKASVEGVAVDTGSGATAETKLGAADDAATLQPATMVTGFSGDNADTAVDAASADLDPHPAAQNYPSCRPGPGDDRCIQLYEPGVREELASWSQPTGGFAGTADTRVAMGGPYEPVDSATETERLNQQALAHSAGAIQTAQADAPVETAMADETGTQLAIGGPYEPVADDAAMNGNGTVDAGLGETPEDEIQV